MTTFERNLGHVSRRRVERFGIPVGSFNPDKFYIICLDYESRPPSIDELVLLRAYRDYIIRHVYIPGCAQKLLEMPFPAIGGHHTTNFKKVGPNAWMYRKRSWTQGPPYVPVEHKGEGAGWKYAGIPLPALLDRVESVGTPEEPARFISTYTAWRALRPKLFPTCVNAPTA